MIKGVYQKGSSFLHIVEIRYYKFKSISAVMLFKILNEMTIYILLDSENKILI